MNAEDKMNTNLTCAVNPTVKHLFNGFDVTLFAYGVTGTGKTHTMRGGKSLAERGVIPRLLSGICRRSRKIERDSQGATSVAVSLSYYEIYNDKVFDLFEPLDKRTASGLPLRDNGGKTVVVGLTERRCTTLKEFESLYDQANMNRSTSATKLNSHSSRSHAILCVKVAITSGDSTRVSTASAIDLAGSEDNRRTDNGKERMIESASINRSLFVLAQCVEAMSKKQQRVPYRESKMTRILSLGQNNGLTVMILNLAPVRSYHLDTLSSLNFANRTKKIEAREIENELMFKGGKITATRRSAIGSSAPRQPLRPLTVSVNANLLESSKRDPAAAGYGKPAKAFAVYSDRPQPAPRASTSRRLSELPKRPSLNGVSAPPRAAAKTSKQNGNGLPYHLEQPNISASLIEEMVEKKVEEILAARSSNEEKGHHVEMHGLKEQVQHRLELLEQRIESTEDARTEGLSHLLAAKHHQTAGEDSSALEMFQLALPFFPQNEKLSSKIALLKQKLNKEQPIARQPEERSPPLSSRQPTVQARAPKRPAEDSDADYQSSDDDDDSSSDDELTKRPRIARRKRARKAAPLSDLDTAENDVFSGKAEQSPHAVELLSAINSRDMNQIKSLKGVGPKKAEIILDHLAEMDGSAYDATAQRFKVNSLSELSNLKGVGAKMVDSMRNGLNL